MKIPKNRVESVADTQNGACRYSLNVVSLDVEAKQLLATDGYMAIVCPVEVEPGDVNGLIPASVLTKARRYGTKSLAVRTRTLVMRSGEADNEEVTVIRRKAVTAPFPDVRAIIPTPTGPPTVVLNAALLYRLLEALGVTKRRQQAVCIWVGEQQTANLIAVSGEDAVGVLMPMRDYTTAESVLEGIGKASAVMAAKVEDSKA